MRESNNGEDAELSRPFISYGFTPINRQPAQPLTPQSSATTSVQQNQARQRKAAGATRRKYHPTVTQHSGLGIATDPAYLGKYAPLPVVPESPPPEPLRKRPRLAHADTSSIHTGAIVDSKDMSTRQRVLRSLRIKEPAHKPAATQQDVACKTLQPLYPPRTELHAALTAANRHESLSAEVFHTVPVQRNSSSLVRTISQGTADATPIRDDLVDLQTLNIELDNYNNTDSAPPDPEISLRLVGTPVFEIDDFANDLNDDDLLMLTPTTCEMLLGNTGSVMTTTAKPRSGTKIDAQVHSAGSSMHIPINLEEGSSFGSSQRSAKKFVSPVTLTTRLLASTDDLGSAEARKPIVRPSFPKPVRNRSPIVGLSPNVLLRICFRVGEAIRQSFQASMSGKSVIIELYARVLESERSDRTQQFTFCDLFHAKPPYIKAVYDAAIWKSVQLFEYDGRRLLQQGRICRCIGTMKRDGKEWAMTIFNIWEATWDDIRWVEGIVKS